MYSVTVYFWGKDIPKELESEFEFGIPDDRSFLVIRDGERTAIYSDCGEPEDNTFYRDYEWVAEELKRAYEAGLNAIQG